MTPAPAWHRARRAVARVAGKLGGYELAEAVSGHVPRILMYHRLARLPAWRKLELTLFDAHLAFVKQNYEVVSLDAVVHAIQDGRPLGARAVAITVDDAYEDFHRLALPVIERHGVPATLFVPTDFVDGNGWLWPDVLLLMVRQTTRSWIDIESLGRIELRTLPQRRSAWNSMADWLLEMSLVERGRWLGRIADKLDVRVPRRPCEDYTPMTWDQVRDAVRRGISVGSQACQHIPLSRESREVQRDEARRSLERLEEQTGQRVLHFSYPHGRAQDFSDASAEAARSAGYVSASMAVPFADSADPLFHLPRLSPPEITADLEMTLSGITALLKRGEH